MGGDDSVPVAPGAASANAGLGGQSVPVSLEASGTLSASAPVSSANASSQVSPRSSRSIIRSMVVGKNTTSSSSCGKTAIKNITFTDPRLLRGSFSTDALQRWGAVLEQKQTTADWYEMSVCSDHLNVFVSHNWSMPRKDKFLILAFYFNMKAAVACTVAVVAAVAVLTALGILPSFVLLHGSRWGPWCQVIGFAVFMLVLFCWQEVGRLPRCRGQLLFLDRACIHQANDELKRLGIEHLAAFLYYSWSMLICYSDEYLQKLWTVYEVATFLVLHPGSAMHVRHSWFAKFVICGMLIVFVHNMVWHVLHVPGVIGDTQLAAASSLVTVVLLAPACGAIAVMVFTLSEKRLQIQERVDNFRFADAKCFSEEDRAIVQRNIVAFMKHVGHADRAASDAQIIQQFEAKIQSDVPKLFAASLGRVGFPYQFAVCTSLPYCLQSFDYVCAQFYNGESASSIWYGLAYTLTMVCAVIPLSFAIGFLFAELVIRRSLCIGRILGISLLALLELTSMGGGYFLLKAFSEMAMEGEVTTKVGFFVIMAVYILATFFVYRPIVYKQHRRRLKLV